MQVNPSTIRSRVITSAEAAADSNMREGTYAQKVVRYIPGEVVATYLALSGIVMTATGIPTALIMWLVTGALIVLTPVWTLYATDIPGKPRPWFQAAASTVAFAVWALTIGGSILFASWYQPVYGSILLILCTFVIPLFEKVFVKPTAPQQSSQAQPQPTN